jgi:hypothetical protein
MGADDHDHPANRAQYLSALAHYIATLDVTGQGVSASEIVDSLYPLRIGDGLEEVREAIAQLTHADHGRAVEPIRLGAVLGRHKGKALPGGICVARGAFQVGMIRWTTKPATSPVPVVAAPPPPEPEPGEEAAEDPPLRPSSSVRTPKMVDDDPLARVRVEMAVGAWLAKNCLKLPHAPSSLTVLAGSSAHPEDFAATTSDTSPRVCVTYTKFAALFDDQLALPSRVWESLTILRQQRKLDVYLCFCSEHPSHVTFDRYDTFAWPSPGITPKAVGRMLLWPPEMGTFVVDFREVTPNLQALLQVGSGAAAPGALPLTRFETMLLQQDRDLIAACQRGWLLTGTAPTDGICFMWRRRCDVERSVFLYVSTFSMARGLIPGHTRAIVRMELDASGNAMADAIIDDLDKRLKPLLTESEYAAMHINSRLVSLQCPGGVAESIGAMLYDAGQHGRAKHLSLVRSPVSSTKTP